MTAKWKDFLRKCQFAPMLACGSLPVPILLVHCFAPDHLAVLQFFPLSYMLLAWLCLLTPGKLRVPAGLLGSAALIYMGLQLLPVAGNIPVMLIPLIYVFLLLFGLQISGWSRETEMSPSWVAIFGVCHVIGQIMVNTAQRTGDKPIYLTTAPHMLVAFIICAALCMLSLNRFTMQSASMGRQRVPVMMRRRNNFFSMGLLALILLISAVPEIIRLVTEAWLKLINGILWLMAFLSQFMPQSSSGGGGGGSMDMSELGGAGEPGKLAVILEKLMTVFAAVAVVALAILLIYKLGQKLKILLGYLFDRLAVFSQISSEDFEDEITDTRDEGEKERISLLDKMRRRLARVDEKSLTPNQRVRYRYLRLMMKHPEWHASQTARETIDPASAALYERARYSETDLSAQEADAFSEQIRGL